MAQAATTFVMNTAPAHGHRAWQLPGASNFGVGTVTFTLPIWWTIISRNTVQRTLRRIVASCYARRALTDCPLQSPPHAREYHP